jgi:uncharacterized MAPEG superfamily protein
MTSSLPTPPYNFSIHAIAGAYALAVPPILYHYAGCMTASNWTATNLAPRTNLDNLKTKIGASTWQMLARARGCHLNALEGFPLFAAAMVSLAGYSTKQNANKLQIVGNYAELGAKEMNFYAAEYLAVRVVYSVLYMTVKTEAASYLRSGAYFWSISIPFYVLWKAGGRLAEKM